MLKSDFSYANLFDNARSEFEIYQESSGIQVDDSAIKAALSARTADAGLPRNSILIILLLLRMNHSKALRDYVIREAAQLRIKLFQNHVAAMVPIEVSSFCASNCSFCGWRSENKEMLRLSLSEAGISEQLDILIRHGFSHFEIVAGDDLAFIKNRLKDTVRYFKERIKLAGINGRVSICLTPLHKNHYVDLKLSGLDCVLTWQETYDELAYKKFITKGPKAQGIDESYKIVSDGSGYNARLESYDNAIVAGLQVGMGVMIGLSDYPEADILALLNHAQILIRKHKSIIKPIIFGMPIWNKITTAAADKKNEHVSKISPEHEFEFIAALYLLSLPDYSAWIFPNCRVSKETQIAAIRTAGFFTSTMVRVGPGGYLLEQKDEDFEKFFEKKSTNKNLSRQDILMGEQFLHHYDSHESYLQLFSESNMKVVTDFEHLP